jgi:hypothetical protein
VIAVTLLVQFDWKKMQQKKSCNIKEKADLAMRNVRGGGKGGMLGWGIEK